MCVDRILRNSQQIDSRINAYNFNENTKSGGSSRHSSAFDIRTLDARAKFKRKHQILLIKSLEARDPMSCVFEVRRKDTNEREVKTKHHTFCYCPLTILRMHYTKFCENQPSTYGYFGHQHISINILISDTCPRLHTVTIHYKQRIWSCTISVQDTKDKRMISNKQTKVAEGNSLRYLYGWWLICSLFFYFWPKLSDVCERFAHFFALCPSLLVSVSFSSFLYISFYSLHLRRTFNIFKDI